MDILEGRVVLRRKNTAGSNGNAKNWFCYNKRLSRVRKKKKESLRVESFIELVTTLDYYRGRGGVHFTHTYSVHGEYIYIK